MYLLQVVLTSYQERITDPAVTILHEKRKGRLKNQGKEHKEERSLSKKAVAYQNVIQYVTAISETYPSS